MNRNVREHTGRVLLLAVAFFGSLAAVGFADGVFARLSPATLWALGLFAAGFAAATYLLDESLRGWVNARVGAALRARARKAPAKSPAARRAAT